MNFIQKSRQLGYLVAGVLLFTFGKSYAGNSGDDMSVMKSYQMGSARVAKSFGNYDNELRKEFKAKGFNYPADNIYIRVFKGHNELEVWVKNNDQDTFSLFKNYKICALSGILGPKRVEGDRQVPEGFYFISDFNPSSDYYLSMQLSYPNYSDLALGNNNKPGGDIYIHGGCVTIGCMPMTDPGIQELYTLCLGARLNGETNIPVHVFPVRFNQGGLNFLGREYKGEAVKQKFWVNIKAGYDYFEHHHKLFPIMYNKEGKYVF